MYSNRTATGMLILHHDYHREAMRSAMKVDAESKQGNCNVFTLQGKVYPLEFLKKVHQSGSSCANRRQQRPLGLDAHKSDLIATGALPTLCVGRAVRISVSTLQK
jgi:hypothetical protein